MERQEGRGGVAGRADGGTSSGSRRGTAVCIRREPQAVENVPREQRRSVRSGAPVEVPGSLLDRVRWYSLGGKEKDEKEQ